LSVFIKLRCAENVCLYYGLRVCEQKYIVIILSGFPRFTISTKATKDGVLTGAQPADIFEGQMIAICCCVDFTRAKFLKLVPNN